mgnify:CR=1 FL=1
MGDLASKYGWQGVFPNALGYTLMFLTYHTTHKDSGEIYKREPRAILGIIVLALNHFLRTFMCFVAYMYADKAQINQGIIAGLFTLGVMFTTLMFWRLYGEKINLIVGGGMLLLCSSVVCVGYRSEDTTVETKSEGSASNVNLYLAIGTAIVASVFFSTTSWAMRHYTTQVSVDPI